MSFINVLSEVSSNVWWSWQPEVWQLFHELNPLLWEEVGHNPVAFVERSKDAGEGYEGREDLHAKGQELLTRQRQYLSECGPEACMEAGKLHRAPVAYFCAEFGLHESLRIYSGGLGILAGDHMKAASDLSIPIMGIGLFYASGYFQQSMDENGWQQQRYDEANVNELPIELVCGDDGQPVEIVVDSGEGDIFAQVWKMNIGRNSLYLLDANVEKNSEEDRALTARLYGGDRRVRIRQELLLGVGGVRLLSALGVRPGALHLNEGHSAFAPLEMCYTLMTQQGISFDVARRRVARQTVFTTHTPVPAGHDRFSLELFEGTMAPLRERLGLDHRTFHDLGRVRSGDTSETFCMTVLAIKMSEHRNGVSNLHGEVSRLMWRGLYPTRPIEDIPIGHVTNGVHMPSFLAAEMRELYNKHLPEGWEQEQHNPEIWKSLLDVDHRELWSVRQQLKRKLLSFIQERVSTSTLGQGEGGERIGSGFREDVLTIGFARRFATYKRATLLLKDMERFKAMIQDEDRPVQFVFAGKAHPHDDGGKALIQEVIRASLDPEFRGRVVFLEDYDINIARHMLQGVDVWLNNPRRPQEACGTSGQKVIYSGALNCSVLDGWWAEGYDGLNGFAIGNGEEFASADAQDAHDVKALYKVLEGEVIPLYYQNDGGDFSEQWMRRVLWAKASLGWRFNANRMLLDYLRGSYLPASGSPSV